MPRTPMIDREPVVEPRPTALVSAASRITGTSSRFYRKPEEWQTQCWHYRDTLGEVRYAAEWFANALSRATIIPARKNPEGVLEPITSGIEVAELDAILGGMGGPSNTMKAIGEHLFVVGECYLLGRAPQTDEEAELGYDITWEVCSSDEVKKRGDRWWIDYGEGERYEVQPQDDLFRIHNPHPRRKASADAPLRAVMTSLREIEMLSLHVQAQVLSRLAGAGILFMSDQSTFTPINPDTSADPVAAADPLMAAIANAAATAIANPGDPSALIPIIVRVPGDEVDKQKLLTFWTELDASTQSMRNEAIRRTALGIDLPPEVLLGTSDVNHWGAWQIEESTIKAHIEPALEVIAAALTRILRKVLDDTSVVCVFDTSALRLRPNRSKEAFELWDRGEITSEALRRETGFSEADDPQDDERKQWYLRKIASGSASPEMVAEALRLLTGIDLPIADNTMNEARPDPSLEPLPDNGPPAMSQREADAQRSALEATCDAVVMRALERAGNRLRNATSSRPEGVEPHEMHLLVKPRVGHYDPLLDGSWSTLPVLLRNQPFSHTTIEKALDAYVRSLFANQQQHDPDTMMRFVDAALS